MKKGIELIVIPIIAFIILTKPRSLVNFSRTMLGKVAMVLLVIGAASRNQVYGLIAATAMVLILENKYEGMAVSDTDAVDNEVPVVDKQEVALEEEEVAGEEAEDEAEDEAEEVAVEEAEDEAEEEVAVGGDGTETFLSGLLSKVGITSSNERIDTERNLQQGKCSNEELSKMH